MRQDSDSPGITAKSVSMCRPAIVPRRATPSWRKLHPAPMNFRAKERGGLFDYSSVRLILNYVIRSTLLFWLTKLRAFLLQKDKKSASSTRCSPAILAGTEVVARFQTSGCFL